MLCRDPSMRLGSNGGAEEVKQHPWLVDFPWEKLNKKKLKAPYIPQPEGNYDQDNIDEPWKDLQNEDFI